MSSWGWGPFGMIHTFTVVPGLISDFAAWLLGSLALSSSSPPQPEYTRAPTRTAMIASAIEYLLRTILSSFSKNGFGYTPGTASVPLAAVTP